MWYYSIEGGNMKDEELHRIIEKYLAGNASAQEIELLNEYYKNNSEGEILWEDEEEESVKKRIFSNIEEGISVNKGQNKPRIWLKIAAVLLVGISIFSIHKLVYQNADVQSVSLEITEKQQINRYILLPDSSIVILKPGSELDYPKSFESANRTVYLKGEAYFDIKHKNNQPFIIHSGKVKTTVLGTAFSIKTYDEQNVEVFVNRGKVKVENQTQELAVLTANQKLTYHPIVNIVPNHNESVVTKDHFEWQDTNMAFDEITFDAIAKKLEQRYNVKIVFKTSNIAQYYLSGAFNGLETIDEMLTILCKTSGSVFKLIDDHTYEIRNN